MTRNIGRRKFLKLLGAGVIAGGASLVGFPRSRRSTPTGKAVDLDDSAIERVEDIGGGAKRVIVKSGAQWEPKIKDKEVMENLLIDLRQGGDFRGVARGRGWTIRNVGIAGKIKSNRYAWAVEKEGTFENLYMGDGAVPGEASGIYVIKDDTPDVSLNFGRVHISKFPNNGIYGSPTVEEERGDIVNIYDSYFNSNNISAFKTGSPHGPCEIVNTTIRTDQDTPGVFGGKINKRALWALDNPGGNHGDWHRTILKDCDIQGRIQAEPGAIVELQNTRWDGSFHAGDDVHESGDPKGKIIGESAGTPDLNPPDNVPMSAEEAATGTASGRYTGQSGGSSSGGSQGTPC